MSPDSLLSFLVALVFTMVVRAQNSKWVVQSVLAILAVSPAKLKRPGGTRNFC
jgi:hypothetical protein